jgi:hypothetical protein
MNKMYLVQRRINFGGFPRPDQLEPVAVSEILLDAQTHAMRLNLERTNKEISHGIIYEVSAYRVDVV